MKEIELENLISDIVEEIKEEEFKKEIGIVTSVSDGIAKISGLLNVFFDEVVKFQSGLIGIVKSMSKYDVTALIIGDHREVN